MHIEPDVVAESKLWLSYLTAAGVGAYTLTIARKEIRSHGLASLAGRSLIASLLVFCFFEVLPHYPIGVSEVHLILGSTLFLLLGAGPAAIGLAAGLLLQGIFFAPSTSPDLA